MIAKYSYPCLGLILFLAGCASLPPAPRSLDQAAAAGNSLAAEVNASSEEAAERVYRLVAGGDVLPGHHLAHYLRRHGHGYPFQKIQHYFQAADIGLVNLECPLAASGKKVKGKKFTFRGRPEAAAALRACGITAVALANNHILDYGVSALSETLAALDQAGVARAGAGMNSAEARKPARIVLDGGATVALLSYSLTFPSEFWATAQRPGTALARIESLRADIADARTWADLVVVCFHWGGELEHTPKPYQMEYGREAVRSGARLVVGTHPHVLQGMEWYQGGLILYSLGNLAFGGGASKRAATSGLVDVAFNRRGELLSARVLPLSVDNHSTRFIPTPLAHDQAAVLLNFLETHSLAWKTRFEPDEEGWGKILPPAAEISAAAPAP